IAYVVRRCSPFCISFSLSLLDALPVCASRFSERVLEPITSGVVDEHRILMGHRCVNSRMTLAVGVDHQLDTDCPSEVLSTATPRSEEHTSELQSRFDLVCRLLLSKNKY